jgi:hypothetical protein
MKTVTLPKIFDPFFCKDIIRLGRENDGGYLVNRHDVEKSTRLLSFGIEDDISFDEDFVKINDCKVDAYDGTIDRNFDFFSSPNRTLHRVNIGYKTNCKQIQDIIDKQESNVFLKCDIEGSEYEILDELIIHSDQFSGIVIEFHDVYQYPLFNLVSNFISKIGLKLIHTHMNNISYAELPNGDCLPGCIELTFSSSKNVTLSKVILPHQLDMPNTTSRDEFRILF